MPGSFVETAVDCRIAPSILSADFARLGEEVRGPGVVGEQPVLKPGQSFRYTSGCPLSTPVGSMHGSYQCIAEDGTAFEATIPEFVLSVPRTLH